jgi:hypothetical protein
MTDTYQETILVNLNSANALQNNGSFLSNVYFNFKNIIQDPDNLLEVEISVANAQIPYSFYNINVYNNVLEVDYNSVPYTLTLTRGNYNATNLITEIQNQFNNASIIGVTITISSITGNILISVSSGTLTLYSNGSTIYKVLGLEIGTDYTITNVTPLTAIYPLNLLGTLRLRVCSYELITYNLDSTNMTSLNVLATIPIESATFGVILYDNISNIKTRLNNMQLDGFDILILDDDDNPVNFNGVPWCISLLFTMTKERQIHPYDKKKFDDFINLGSIANAYTALPSIPSAGNNPEPTMKENKIFVQDEPIPMDEQFTEPLDNLEENSLDLLLYNNKLDPITGMIKP